MRNRNFKRIITIFALTTVLVTGCADKGSTQTGGTASGETQSVTQESSSQNVVSGTEAGTQKETQKETEKQTQAGSTQTPTKAPQADGNINSLVVEGKYTVYDPDNKRGLDTTGKGWGYGYAKDGKPHQISIDNQARFDKLKSQGIEALALDTKSQNKVLYLTFDCGYEYNNNTPKILDVLKTKNVKAAFFCTKPFVTGYGNVVQRMINEGHVVGNHSTTHPVFTKISRHRWLKNYGE